MAQTKKPKAAPRKKKATKAKVPGRALVSAKPKKSRSRRAGNGPGVESLAKLLDHPLVSDLLAIGAIAAVAAIADHKVKGRTGEAEKGSKRALKAAGKAAAAAIGKRLMTEVEEVRKAAKKAAR